MRTSVLRFVRSSTFAVIASTLVGGVYAAGCGNSSSPSTFPGSHGDAGFSSDATADVSLFGNGSGDSGLANTSSITVTPATPTVTVTITDGVPSSTPLTFTAKDTATGATLSPTWSLDRAELGSISSAGVFTASGNAGGVGNVTASFEGKTGTTSLTVAIVATNHGANSASGIGVQTPDSHGQPPSGGYNGVGGVVLGGAPSTSLQTLLDGTPTTSTSFTWLYPYDKTVWPRGFLAPLLQWAVPSGFNATAVKITLSEKNFSFSGYYAGSALVNQPLDEAIWTAATIANGGDPLHVEIRVTDGTTVYGPIAEDWTIAPGVLQGTVYYNSYNTQLNGPTQNGSDGNGAVLAIKPGASAPALAVPSMYGQCHVCHEVSENGSTLFTDNTSYGDYGYGDSIDLTQTPPAELTRYDTGSNVIGMFTYSGVYPDGKFALANSQENYHAYQGNSDLFDRTTTLSIPSTGFTTAVTRAVTPSFSPDGQHVAFNFWAGPGANGVTAGNGQSLVVMDFACGATTPGGSCGAPPYAFSALRTLYQDTNTSHYVGWPVFTPDSANIIFQHTITGSTAGGSVLNTPGGAQAQLMIANVPTASGATTFSPMQLCALNGLASDCTTNALPTNSFHPNDTLLNFEPTVTPIASGGYFWVLFTTRRMYGNVAAEDPYYPTQGEGDPTIPVTKKLWIAAIDINPKPGVDPSHPAFYLPGQELNAGNMHGYWVNDPCHADGASCLSGDQCCGGYCAASAGADGGQVLTCTSKSQTCSQQYDKCTTTSDCCTGASLQCIDGFCSLAPR